MPQQKEELPSLGICQSFVSSNGVDTWVNRDLFHSDDDGHPNPVAGVPPDVFSEDGKHWGNPHYNWEAHEAEGFAWWIKRLESERRLTDQIRIDHFRGFAAAWESPDRLVEMRRTERGSPPRALNSLMRSGHTLEKISPSLLKIWELSRKM